MRFLWGFSFLGSLLLCILKVESLGESFEISFISWIIIDILCERGECLSDFSHQDLWIIVLAIIPSLVT